MRAILKLSLSQHPSRADLIPPACCNGYNITSYTVKTVHFRLLVCKVDYRLADVILVIDHRAFLSATSLHFRVHWIAEKHRKIEINLINAMLGRNPRHKTLLAMLDDCGRTVRLSALGS